MKTLTRGAAFSGMVHTWHFLEIATSRSLSDLMQRFSSIIPGYDAVFISNGRKGFLQGPRRNKENEGEN